MSLTPVSSTRLDWTVAFLRDLYGEVRDSNVPFMAGSIAYSAFVSLLPLLVLALLVATAVGGQRVAELVVTLTEQYLSPAGQQLLADSLTRASEQAELSVLTVAVFLWATLRVFRGLDTAFSILYDTGRGEGLLHQLRDGAVVFASLMIAFAGTIAVNPLFNRLPPFPVPGVLETVSLVVFLLFAFLPMYYVFPDASLSVGDVLPGVVVAAVGWTALEIGFEFYVVISSKTELYGVIGGIILLVTWLYLGALVVLLGATVNAVLTKRAGTVRSDPRPA